MYLLTMAAMLHTSVLAPPFRTQNYLGRAILSRLNVIRKMMRDPAGIAQVGNLDGDGLR